MIKSKRASANKQDLWNEISEQLKMQVDPSWYSSGSNVSAPAFEAALLKIAEKTGVPPSFFDEKNQLIWRMLHKSQEAMIQAIQTVNNPAIIYRLETFLFLFVNAWELMLKSYIVKSTGRINEIEVTGDEEKSISLKKCINKVFVREDDPVRTNLIMLTDLRNQVAHKTIPIFPETVSMLAQAGIFNYEKHLNNWFARSLNDKIPGGMVFLVSSLDPANYSVDYALLSKKLTKDVAGILKEFESKIKGVIEMVPESELSFFAIPISINTSSINNPKKADLLSFFDPNRLEDAVFVERKISTLDQYPLSYSDLWEEVKRREPEIKQHTLNEIINKHGIKSKLKYAGYSHRTKKDKEIYKTTGRLKSTSASIYNYSAVEFICQEFQIIKTQ